MSDTLNLICCLPIFLLWFGPGLLVVFCLVFDGCARIDAWRRGQRYIPRSALASGPQLR
jgi:hypothetical protein